MPVRPMYPGEGSGNGTGAVNSVNGEQGDVVITAQDLNAQPASTVLTDIAAITMPENSFLHTNGSGNFTPSLCMPAGLAWLSYTTVDQQKDHLALAEVASSGDYSDLTNKPTAFTPAVHTHTISDVTGLQSSLDSKLGVGASIPYSSLTGAPTIPAAQVNSDWTATSGVSQVLNKPTFATVATTGSYDDLTNKPVIPSVNYPVISVNTKIGAVVLTNTDVGAAASVHTHAISDITNLQSTLDSKANTASLSGYATTASLIGYATTGALTTGLAGKFNTPTGTTSQYIRGDGSLVTFPAIPTVPTNISAFTNDSGYLTNAVLTGYRKVETFLGTSDANGNVTIIFTNTYSTPPDVQPQIIGGTFNQSVRVVSVSTTGCVVQAAQRNVVTLLSVEVLLGATVNLAGASVTVQVTPRS